MGKLIKDTYNSFTDWDEFKETYWSGRGLVCWQVSSLCTHAWWVGGTFLHQHLNAIVAWLAKTAGPFFAKAKVFTVAVFEVAVQVVTGA